MHLIRFRDPAGSVREGRVVDDRVVFGDRTYPFDAVDVIAPCEPTKIVCVGLNYADHAAERDSAVPDRPLFFLKGPNAVASHGSTVTLPAGKTRIDWEAEFAVVIDTQAKAVEADEAMDYVAGYTCLNDISNRDDQDTEVQWVRGKAFDNAAPMGPVLATPDEVPDDATIELRANGETMQSSAIDQFLFSVPDLIAELTQYLTLEPGDVISTGTPAGVGALSDGDHIEVEIEGIGTLEHDVAIPSAD